MSVIAEGQAALLKKTSGHRFYNLSPLTFATLLNDDKTHAVLEAVRAGHRTTSAIQEALHLTYATANRRVNELLALGRLQIDRTAHARSPAFTAEEADKERPHS